MLYVIAMYVCVCASYSSTNLYILYIYVHIGPGCIETDSLALASKDAGEPDGRRGWHRRRFWIAVKMMCIIIPSGSGVKYLRIALIFEPSKQLLVTKRSLF